MKHALVAYGVLVVVLTMLARRFEAAGWTALGALDVVAALLDALLVLAVAAGLLLAGRLGLQRWARSMAAWRRHRAAADDGTWDEAEVIGVTSWRPDPPPLPPAPPPSSPVPESPSPAPAGFTYVGPSYARETPVTRPFPEEPGARI